MDNIKTIAVLGLGTLGAQIALQAAAKGFIVKGFDPVPGQLNAYLDKMPAPGNPGKKTGIFDTSAWFMAAEKVRQYDTLALALKDADLVIEAVPEDLSLKGEIWRQMDRHTPDHAILATNSSSIPVSRLESYVSRPENCLNIHIYQLVFGHTMADIMGGTKTLPAIVEAGRQFVIAMGLVPLTVNKELLGFCFNRVWRSIKRETLYMWGNGYVDFMDIDRAYMIFNNTTWGPFALMDGVGLDVVWDIEMVYYNESQNPMDHPPEALQEKIAAGQMGVKSGKGFYTYPNPAYASPNFLIPG